MARAKFRLELDGKGIQEVLKSPQMVEVVRERGKKIAAQAKRNSADPKSEYSVKAFVGRDRARAHVGTANPAAMMDEARNRALTRAQGVR